MHELIDIEINLCITAIYTIYNIVGTNFIFFYYIVIAFGIENYYLKSS